MTTSPYITEISTNIKGIAEPIKLMQPRVLLSGANGSGKSAHLNAIELALFGHADDLLGRDNVKTSILLRELDASGLVHATVKMSDGNQALWSLGQGAKAKHEPLPYPAHLPMKPAMKALSGSRVVTLRYLYSAFGPDDNTATAEEAARKLASEHKKVAKACQGALETMGIGGAPAPKDDLIRAIGTLTKYQIEQKKSTCGVCGEKNVSSQTFQTRFDRVVGKLPALPPITNDGIRGLIAARDEAQVRVDHHTARADALLSTIEEWFEQKKDRIEKALGGGPLGAIGIKADSKSYILIGRLIDDNVWPVVSGAETILLAMTLVKAARKPQGLNLLVLPDRAFDPKMFRALLRLASSIKGTNVIVQSVLTPKVVPTHWDNVKLGGA